MKKSLPVSLFILLCMVLTKLRRLTTFQGRETDPYFSPDGKLICFTAAYDGNTDVYVTSTGGGNPLRLTWHPGADHAKGWAPDGKVMFSSGRTRVPLPTTEQFWSVDPAGGFLQRLIIPRVANSQFNEDASRFADQMNQPWESEFRHYRGGQNNPIWIMDMNTHEIEKVPWEGSIGQKPTWIGDEVYFLSDRDTVSDVWSFNISSRQLRQRTFFTDFDTKNVQSGGGKLVIENAGYLHIQDPGSGEPEMVPLEITADLPWARVQWVDVSRHIHSSDKQHFTSPGAGIFGPKVMTINESAGSGGDYLPCGFQKKKIGPLVGTRTWSGLVGWVGAPPLVDGGYMGAPRWGFFNTDGEWDVENIGVTPDVLVEQVPRLVIAGRDPQLEKAIEIALEMLETDGVELKPQPPDPVRVLHKRNR